MVSVGVSRLLRALYFRMVPCQSSHSRETAKACTRKAASMKQKIRWKKAVKSQPLPSFFPHLIRKVPVAKKKKIVIQAPQMQATAKKFSNLQKLSRNRLKQSRLYRLCFPLLRSSNPQQIKGQMQPMQVIRLHLQLYKDLLRGSKRTSQDNRQAISSKELLHQSWANRKHLAQ